jgi:hypothetical protein
MDCLTKSPKSSFQNNGLFHTVKTMLKMSEQCLNLTNDQPHEANLTSIVFACRQKRAGALHEAS